jgi:hypothetical protein
VSSAQVAIGFDEIRVLTILILHPDELHQVGLLSVRTTRDAFFRMLDDSIFAFLVWLRPLSHILTRIVFGLALPVTISIDRTLRLILTRKEKEVRSTQTHLQKQHTL